MTRSNSLHHKWDYLNIALPTKDVQLDELFLLEEYGHIQHQTSLDESLLQHRQSLLLRYLLHDVHLLL